MKKRIVSALLAVSMLTGLLTACGTQTEVKETSKESNVVSAEDEKDSEELEPITITMGVMGTKWDEYPDNSVANYIREKFGITIESFDWAGRKETLLATGELPDVFIVEKTEVADLIDAGFIMPLDDLINEYAPHIAANEDVLDFQRENYYDGEHIYGLTQNYIELSDGSLWQGNFGLNLDWERYGQLGYPEIENDVDSIYKLLTDMVALKPTTDEGLPVYAIEYPIWGSWGWFVAVGATAGYYHANYNGMMAVNLLNGELEKMMSDPDSFMWQWCHMYFKLNQDGLLDADSLSGNDGVNAQKAANGQYVAQISHLSTGATNSAFAQEGVANGFQYIPLKGSSAWCGGDYSYGGGNVRCIAADAEHPERIMQLLDWMYSSEGMRILLNGVEGETWNYENGVPTLTDEAKAAYAAMDDTAYNYGLGMAWNIGLLGKAEDGYNVNLFLESDYLKASQTPLDKDVEAHYGMTMKEKVDAMVADGSMVDQGGPIMRVQNMKVTPPEEINAIANECSTVFYEGMAKCVIAEDEETFFEIKDETIERMIELGIEQVEEYYLNEYNSLMEQVAN